MSEHLQIIWWEMSVASWCHLDLSLKVFCKYVCNKINGDRWKKKIVIVDLYGPHTFFPLFFGLWSWKFVTTVSQQTGLAGWRVGVTSSSFKVQSRGGILTRFRYIHMTNNPFNGLLCKPQFWSFWIIGYFSQWLYMDEEPFVSVICSIFV